MAIGLTREELQYIKETVVTPLNELGAEVYCFGSRAREDYQRGSDLDLMVVSDHGLAREISSIAEKLENSNFPYLVEIIEENKFARAYLENYKEERIPINTDSRPGPASTAVR